jgi:hypothetical protein
MRGRGRYSRARTHLRGIVCAMDERYAEAEESGLSAIELDPKEVGPYVMLASVYACVRQYRKMLAVLRRAVGVDPMALRYSLSAEPQGDDRAAGAPRRRSTSRRGSRGPRRYHTHSLPWLCLASPQGRTRRRRWHWRSRSI